MLDFILEIFLASFLDIPSAFKASISACCLLISFWVLACCLSSLVIFSFWGWESCGVDCLSLICSFSDSFWSISFWFSVMLDSILEIFLASSFDIPSTFKASILACCFWSMSVCFLAVSFWLLVTAWVSFLDRSSVFTEVATGLGGWGISVLDAGIISAEDRRASTLSSLEVEASLITIFFFHQNKQFYFF